MHGATLLLCITVLALVVGSHAAPTGGPKEVTSLPGWNGTLPVKTYSGFVETKHTAPPNARMYMHYMLMESAGDVRTDPVIVWWNGGPGASSMWGMFSENGPMLLNELSLNDEYRRTGVPQLVENPYAWTKFATLIVLATPPPVGFSYCDPPGARDNGTSCGVWDDFRAAKTDAEALYVIFTEHFPHLLDTTELFLMGESYAGVFISTTAQELFTNPQYKGVASKVAGVALGDACLGSEVICGPTAIDQGPYYRILFLYGHGQASTEMYEQVMSTCTTEELKSPKPLSASCQKVVDGFDKSIGGYYAYDLYDNCRHQMFSYGVQGSRVRPLPWNKIDGYACGGNVYLEYFNHTSVREALGVSLNSSDFIADNGNGMVYKFDEKNVLPFLSDLLNNKTKNSVRPVRIMVYNADADPAVISFATEHVWYQFAKTEGFAKNEAWRPWTTGQNIVGGYVTEWKDNALAFVTVRGSGHMVPMFKPHAAGVFVKAWIRKEDYPTYTPQ